MKRIIIGAIIAATSFVCLAQGEKTVEELSAEIKALLEKAPVGPHGGKLISPEIKALMDQRSGGMVTPKTNGKMFQLLDARGADDGHIEEIASGMRQSFHVPMTTGAKTMPEGADAFDFAKACKTPMLPAVVLVVDREKMPALSIYPEDTVGIVNVRGFKTDDAALYKERLGKEIWRATALALGAYAMTAPNGKMVGGVLAPVHSLADLDALKGMGLSPTQYNGIYGWVEGLGLKPARPVPYSAAVKQGWAPAPTNAIQRSIWNRVQSEKEKGPANALKIAPPAQKK